MEWLLTAPELGWAIAIIAVILLCIQTGIFFTIWIKFDNALIDWLTIQSKHRKKE